MVIVGISKRFSFQVCQLNEEVHASVTLANKFPVPSGIEDVILKYYDEYDNTSQHLHPEIGPIERQSSPASLDV